MVQDCSNASAVARLVITVAAGVYIALASATGADAAIRDHICKSADVTVFAERVHVRCNAATSDGIVYFAISTANSGHAARILSLLTSAHVSGRSIRISYDTDDKSGEKFGCAVRDCRTIISVGVI